MKIIATSNDPSMTFFLADLKNKKHLVVPFQKGQENTNCDNSRPAHRPFGITWDKQNIYIASRKSLLVYDDQLNWVDKIEILDENTHQITMVEDRIAVCMTRKDCIALINPKTKETEMFHPIHGWAKDFPTLSNSRGGEPRQEGFERFHINSILYINEKIYFLMHRPLKLIELDLKSKKSKKIFSHISPHLTHGILLNKDQEASQAKTLLLSGGLAKMNKYPVRPHFNPIYFARGICGSYDSPWISLNNTLVFDKDVLPIPKHKNIQDNLDQKLKHLIINDMRSIDSIDDAHHNPDPFPYSWA